VNTKDEFDTLSLSLWPFLFSCFIGGLMVCVHMGTFEDEGFFWALIGGFIMAMFIGIIALCAAVAFLKVEQYCEREELSDTARGIVVVSCLLMIMILLTYLFQEYFLDIQH